MQEKTRPRREVGGLGPGGLGSVFDGGADGTTLATVMNGPYSEQLPAGGMTVGEIRARYRDRFDIDPQSQPIVDGNVVDETTVLRAGEVLVFSRKSGEKGALAAARPRAGASIEILRNQVRVTTPEGRTWSMGLEEMLHRIHPAGMDTCRVVPPDGFKGALSIGPVTVWVHQTPPKVHNLRWIAGDSPVPYGRRATYREVRIALPYVVIFAVFYRDDDNRLQITHSNECFFRNDPLKSFRDELMFPALLNCSKFEDPDGKPLSWICSQHMKTNDLESVKDDNERMRRAFERLRKCLLDTGFNYSSDHHEGASWFTASRKLDPRIGTIEAWERATAEDPWFVTGIPWLPVGLTVEEVAERIIGNQEVRAPRVRSARDVARIVTNHGRPGGNRSPAEGPTP